MDSQQTLAALLHSINQIKWMVGGSITAFVLGVGGIVMLSWRESKKYKNTMISSGHDTPAESFRQQAQDLLDQGRLDEMIEIVGKRLSEFPHDIYALYFMANARCRQKQYAEARAHMALIKDLWPPWSETVDTFLKNIPSE